MHTHLGVAWQECKTMHFSAFFQVHPQRCYFGGVKGDTEHAYTVEKSKKTEPAYQLSGLIRKMKSTGMAQFYFAIKNYIILKELNHFGEMDRTTSHYNKEHDRNQKKKKLCVSHIQMFGMPGII